LTLAQNLEKAIASTSNSKFCYIEIGALIHRSPLTPTDIVISSDLYLSDNAPGLVIFTSGTTGPPKAAVKRRAFLNEASIAVADMYGVTKDDVVLHVLPVHHATGIGVTLLPFLLAGACVEFRSGGFDAAWMWERWKQGGLTYFSGVPTIYMRMMQYYENNLADLPVPQRNKYIAGARQFKALLCGTSALPRNLQQKWTVLRDGKVILTRYGATEFGAIFMVSPTLSGVPEVRHD
jgi:malonyl-CoA/methylmalonyl-CoA synthetase